MLLSLKEDEIIIQDEIVPSQAGTTSSAGPGLNKMQMERLERKKDEGRLRGIQLQQECLKLYKKVNV